MMNWNSNDTKYIIKRIILYFIIAGIVFFACQSCAKAQVGSNIVNYGSNPRKIQFLAGDRFRSSTIYNAAGNPYTIWGGLGQGYVLFTVLTTNGTTGTSQLQSIEIASTTREFVCDIGTTTNYIDSQQQATLYSVTCPVDFSDGNGWKYIYVYRNNSFGELWFHWSDVATYVSEVSDAAAITAAQQQAANQQITAIQNQALETRTKIETEATRIVNATNANTTAINNQTEAINNQIEWFEEQHDPLIDTGFLDVMGDLITTNDSDVVRQFILIPFNLFVQIYNACTSNTCSPLTLGTLYGTTLTLPCINWTTLVGSAIANTIDIIFSACLIFGMYRMIKHMINKIFTLSSTITDECGVEVFN